MLVFLRLLTATLVSMEPSQTPFDEKAALEELERLRDAIQAARRARIAKSEEFDEFVKGFKTPPAPPPADVSHDVSGASGASKDAPCVDDAPFGASTDAPYKDAFGSKNAPSAEAATGAAPIDLPTPAPVAELLTLTPTPEPPLTLTPEPTLTPAPEPAAQMFERLSRMLGPEAQGADQRTAVAEPSTQTTPFPRDLDGDRQSLSGQPSPSTPTVSHVAAVDVDQPRAAAQPRRYRANRIFGAVAIASVGLIAMVLYFSRAPSSRVAEAPAPAMQPTPAPAETPTAPAPTVALPAPVAAVNVELRTLQPVWMRITVDGEKQREGTVPAGERLQLHADRAIVIRAGNGADVMVKTANGETPLGVAGQPITFTFTKAAGKS